MLQMEESVSMELMEVCLLNVICNKRNEFFLAIIQERKEFETFTYFLSAQIKKTSKC